MVQKGASIIAFVVRKKLGLMENTIGRCWVSQLYPNSHTHSENWQHTSANRYIGLRRDQIRT